MPRTGSLTKTQRHEIEDLLLTRLSIDDIAKLTEQTNSCVQMIANRWYVSSGCSSRTELMANEILRLKEQISGIPVN